MAALIPAIARFKISITIIAIPLLITTNQNERTHTKGIEFVANLNTQRKEIKMHNLSELDVRRIEVNLPSMLPQFSLPMHKKLATIKWNLPSLQIQLVLTSEKMIL